MITRGDYDRARAVMDDAANALADVLRSNLRGRPSLHPRVLLVGMYLSQASTGSAEISKIYTLLTQTLPLDLQVDLGVRDSIQAPKPSVSKRSLYHLTRCIDQKLGFTVARHEGLTDQQRRDRKDTLARLVSTILAPTLLPRPKGNHDYALDGSGIPAPEDAPRTPKDLVDQTGHEEDIPHIDMQQTASLQSRSGRGSKGASDALWGYRTHKNGRNIFFGYDLEALIRVPGMNEHGDDRSEPALVEALTVIPASTDIVEPCLDLITQIQNNGSTIKNLLVDRLYSYKQFDRWYAALLKLGVQQVLDLTENDHGFADWRGTKVVAGHPHCPGTPDHLGTITRPGPEASAEEKQQFQSLIDQRQSHAFQIVNRPTHDSLKVKARCPALAGFVGCPLRNGTVAAAVENGLPIVEPPESDPAPCCIQDTVTLAINSEAEQRIMKTHQPHYWGSEKWEASFARRTYVEGWFGSLKNSAVGRLNDKTHQYRGLPLVTIVLAVAAAVTNTHQLRKWHHDTQRGDPTHPLLKPDPIHLGTVLATPDILTTLANNPNPHQDKDAA